MACLRANAPQNINISCIRSYLHHIHLKCSLTCQNTKMANNNGSLCFKPFVIHTHNISQIIINSGQMSRETQLVIIIILAICGSIGNGYMISAVMVEDQLIQRGNAFLANIALADLLITGLVMPASAVVILADFQDSPPVCNFQWFIAILCWLVTVLTFAAIAAENYARLCLTPECYAALTPARITTSIFAIWFSSGFAVTVQFIYNLGSNCLIRRFPGSLPNQIIVTVFFVVIPAILTLVFYIRIKFQVQVAKLHPSFKPPVAFNWDYSLMKTNMHSFILFYVFLLPFFVILGIDSIRPTSARLFYNLMWLALSKSCVNNMLYCIENRHFRNAYVNLFRYCCCKTSVAFSRSSRDARHQSGNVSVPVIRVHMYSHGLVPGSEINS